MELKKSIINLFFILILTSVSFSSHSENIDECASNIEDFVNQIDKNEDVKKFLNNIKNSEKMRESVDCAANSLVMTLPSKVLYLIFGDVTKETISWSLALTRNDVDITNHFNEMKENFNGFSSISIVFTSITTIVMIITSLILIFQAFKIFNGTAKDLDFMGKNVNKSWTIIKFTLGLSLIVPISNGYSLAQMIVLIAASIGTFFANLFWLFLLTIINLIMSVNYQNFIDESDLKDGSINKLTSNIIEMQLCDIEKRNILFDISKESDFITLNNHKKSEFQECLNKDYEINNNNNNIFVPKELSKTNYCANKVFGENLNSCGSLNIKIEEKGKIKEIINKSRTIAENIYSLPCMDKNILKSYGKPYQSGYVCAEIKNGDYSFNGESIKYINTQENIEEKFKNIKLDIEKIKLEVENIGNEIIIKNINESDLNETKNKIKRGISNGWYSASHFLNDSTNAIKSTMSTINQSWDLINATSNLDSNEDILKNKNIEEENILFKFNDSLNEVWKKTNENEKNILYTLGIKNFFKGIFSLNSFLGIKDNNIIEEIKKEDSCFKDFSNCEEASLNPLYDYIKMGNDILEKSSIVIITTEGASFALKLMKKEGVIEMTGIYGAGIFVMGILISLLKIYFAVGLLIVYGTPFIPFLYFLSYIISWNILVIEGVITAQIWGMLHLLITKKEGFSENVQIGYNLIFTIALQPIILVIAMIISLIATSIAIGIFNVLFGILMSSLPLSSTPSTIMEFVFTIIAYLIYAILLTIVILKITKIIFEIPDSLTQTLKLTQMPAGGAHGWSEVMQRMNTILNVKVLNALRI